MLQLIPLFLVLPSTVSIDFPIYRPSEQYKCGSFLKGHDDKALTLYYKAIDQFIRILSSPFPHQDLLNTKALSGDLNEIKESLETKYEQASDPKNENKKKKKHIVLKQERRIILHSVSLVVFSAVFTISYLVYRLLACCICERSSSGKKASTDGKFDGCTRNSLNVLLALLVLVQVFAAAAILITGQYAEYGMEELPSRLIHCIDDLNLYKRDSDMRIRKLLIDDYQTLNASLTHQLAHAGHTVVDRVKRLTGAHALDTLMNISTNAQDVITVLTDAKGNVRHLNEEASRFEAEFARLRKSAADELLACIEHEIDPLKAMCHKTERLLSSLSATQFRLSTHFLSESSDENLRKIVDANITSALEESNAKFTLMEEIIQQEIDKRVYSAQNTMKMISDDLFVVAETISTQIRQVNFDPLYKYVSLASDDKGQIRKYMQYSWYVSLGITAIFVLLALCFFLGVFYGICGRRPTFYNDDCCVRSTGSRFLSCGIWLSVVLFFCLSLCTVLLLFFSSNLTNLVCQPLRDPLSRSDVMSLVERYLDIWKTSHRVPEDVQKFLEQRTPADIIRACQRNETFYEIFALDNKYRLNHLKDFEKDSYEQLEKYLQIALNELPEIQPFSTIVSKEELERLGKLSDLNISNINKEALEKIHSLIQELDLSAKAREFEESINNSGGGREKPRAVSQVLEQIKDIQERIADPLRQRLQVLHDNLTRLDTKLNEVQVPISSLIAKIQHAQALLSENVKLHFEKAAKDEFSALIENIDDYAEHVRTQMQTEVSSCKPIGEIAYFSTAALCSKTVDPLNGAWMSMLISLLCLAPIVLISTSLTNLYNKMHPYPKYSSDPSSNPNMHHPMSSFVTDTYDTTTLRKPAYMNYSYRDDYNRTYR
ncbi:hypothetical protein WR25_09188 isoform A [Diploscapter pachys]|uniref:Prominin n=1 Tax=Diploscapter pachys TaxID=2018661 RepID=A0A2A2LY92_9BILA|nr:hypothetical protein WR25_09188 isoform A [Diploscapter pachys]